MKKYINYKTTENKKIINDLCNNRLYRILNKNKSELIEN